LLVCYFSQLVHVQQYYSDKPNADNEFSCHDLYRIILFPVVWNPWVEKAKEISDFGDDEFPNMVCVESGHVSSPVILLPGTAFEASQILQVSQLNFV